MVWSRGPTLFFCMGDIQFSQYHLLKRQFIIHYIVLHFCQKSMDHKHMGLFLDFQF